MNWLFITAHSFAYWLENKAELLHDWAYRHQSSYPQITDDGWIWPIDEGIYDNILNNNARFERLKSKKADQ